MNKYRINKLYIKNFKLFDEIMIDFSKGNIIILDGPNGFGKTTIFDAIELVLTEKISRMVDVADNRYGSENIIIRKDPSKDVVIKIEFKSLEDKFTLIKKIDKNNNYNNMDKRIRELENLFKTYKTKKFNSKCENKHEINQKNINDLFDINLSRFYSLFHYIQQEDNTYFLKKKEKERMKIIKKLFDTYKEENELEKLTKIKKKLSNIYKTTYEDIQKITDNIKSKNKNLSKRQETNGNINYKCLLPWLEQKKEWDKEKLDIQSKDKRDKYKRELDSIENFIKYFPELKKSRFNQELKIRLKNEKLLKDTIIIGNFIDKFTKIKTKYKIQERLKKYNKILKSKKIEDINNKINFEKLPKKIKSIVNINNINEITDNILKMKKNSSELSNLVNELNVTRSSLMEQFNEINNKDDKIINKECPLCGYDWGKYDKLIEEIERKKEIFDSYCDKTMKIVQKKTRKLYENYLSKLISSIDDYLSEEENLIDARFYKQLNNSYTRKNKVEDFIEFCINQKINITKHINKKFNESIENIDEKINNLKEEIKQKYKNISDEYNSKKEKKDFKYLYKNLFNEKDELVSNLSIKFIKKKKGYIDHLYYNNVIQEINAMEENKDKLISKLEKINDKLDSLKTSIKAYKRCIKKHWKKIIKKIEIPFYIYSGKIIQNYQRGMGIFIKGNKDNEELDNIKFVPNINIDHDVINYLSSGQLSGLIIAFTLTLNKVYGNKQLGTIFIDDPVQTMDDINMASFVEVLRNNFSNKQIIMSTHEDNVSKYIRYKFAKYNLSHVRFNVKEGIQNSLS